MATYLLRPQDGGKDIAIPFGKTTIGRGPFLGVSDKRVSRSHAVLELRDGNLTVLPLHTNPTFYKASVKEELVALKKNKVQDLASGNMISLLPDALCFEIIYEGSLSKNGLMTKEVNSSKSRTEHTLPSTVVDDHEKPSASSKVPSESFLDEFLDSRPLLETSPSAATGGGKKRDPKNGVDDKKESKEFLDTHTLKAGKELKEFHDTCSVPTTTKENTVSTSKPQVKPAPLLQKTRKLPSWLIKSTSLETKSPGKKEGNRKGKCPASSTGDKTTTSSKGGKTSQRSSSLPQKKQVASGSDFDEEFIASNDDEESRSLKKKGKEPKIPKKRTSTDIQESDDDIKIAGNKKRKRALSDDDDVPMKPAKNQAKPAKPVVTVGAELSSGSEEDVKPVASEKRVETKTPEKDRSATSTPPLCPYGSKCYRKNPLHFKEYSHLDKDSKADSDNDDDDKAAGESDEDDDDRPKCPYGTSCYRRNPQHKRDFKHTEAPGRSKRKKSKHKSVLNKESDDDGPNTYDYNDSFLDDGEGSGSSYSAGSDDSDWRPQGEDDDDDDEDVTELLTEARGFLRSKKMAKPV